MELAESFRAGVWGQGFPAPAFDDTFEVADQRWVGGKHLRLRLHRGATGATGRFDGIAFNQEGLLPEHVRAVYRLDVNEYQGTQSLQLLIDHWEPA